jgi:small GTP-binding protein
MAAQELVFKLIIVGDASTGKTSLTHRYLSGIFVDNPRLTIGVDFFSKKFKLEDGRRVKLQIWDFGGEERYRFLLPTYSKGANGALILYSIDSPATLVHVDDYVKIIRENANDIPVILAGSKLDLEDHRQVSRESGINVAKHNALAGFVEVSSKTNTNIEDSFKIVVSLMIKNAHLEKPAD